MWRNPLRNARRLRRDNQRRLLLYLRFLHAHERLSLRRRIRWGRLPLPIRFAFIQFAVIAAFLLGIPACAEIPRGTRLVLWAGASSIALNLVLLIPPWLRVHWVK